MPERDVRSEEGGRADAIVFEPGGLYRRREIVERLKVSETALDGWLARRGVPRIELSRRAIRFRGDDLNHALRAAPVACDPTDPT